MHIEKPIVSRRTKSLIEFTGKGITSGQEINVRIETGKPGQGIIFAVPHKDTSTNSTNENEIFIPARVSNVVNTLRNVTLGSGNSRLCIVEHFLSAASLWGLSDITVHVSGPEMPLGDGSASIWIELFHNSGIIRKHPDSFVQFDTPIVVSNKERMIIGIPDNKFSVTYLMDWPHPLIGKRWQSWNDNLDIQEIVKARTFGSMEEHKLLGLENDVISLTAHGFSQTLHYEDEPVRHKLLDLIGDLALCGINPLSLNMRFVSIKAGHELDVQMAKQLQPHCFS